MNKADKLLIKHNMLPGYKGYNYIKEILESNILNADMNITDIYGEIAKKYNTKGSRVERAIRHIFTKSDICKTNKISLSLLQIEYEGEN